MRAELLPILLAAFASVALASLSLSRALERYAQRWRTRFGVDVGSGLKESFIHLDADRMFRAHLALIAMAAGVAMAATGQPGIALAIVVIVGALPAVALRWLRQSRRKRLSAQWPDAVMLIAGGLRAGASIQQAIRQAATELPAPAGKELDLALREQRLGVAFDEAMAHLEQRVRMEEVSLFVASVRIAQDSGGNLAETLERLADTLRRKAVLEGKIDALTAQGRLQGWVMVALPGVVGVALALIDADAMRPLWTTWQGGGVCAGVLVFEGLGLHVIRRIVSIDV
jgi:tight adherence protein B